MKRCIAFISLGCLFLVGCSDVGSGQTGEIEPLGHPKSEGLIVYAISSTGWKGLTRSEMRNLLSERRREFELTAVACLEAEGLTCEARFAEPLTSEEAEQFENWLKGKEIDWEAFTGDEPLWPPMPACVKFEHELCGLIYFPVPEELEDPESAVHDPIQVNKLDSHWYAYEEDWN